MKRTTLVVVLVLALTFAFAASASATTGKFFKGGVDYYTWTNPTGSPSPGTAWVASGLSGIGVNAANPGAHANYLATTAKCGMCHSVHRAAGDGTKLLPTADATCAGCHVGGTAVTAKVITWADVNLDWVPEYGDNPATPAVETDFITNQAAAGGGGGPHNDPVWDTRAGVRRHRVSDAELRARALLSLRLLHPPLPRHQPARRQQLQVQDLRLQAAVQQQPG